MIPDNINACNLHELYSLYLEMNMYTQTCISMQEQLMKQDAMCILGVQGWV